MANLMDAGTRCLLVQSQFSRFSFWNYVEICRLVGAKYPAAPLGLMTVAALLPQHWEFKLVDENVEPLLDEHFEWADIVCTGGMLPQQKSVLSIIERANGFGCPVVVGGPDPTSQPDKYRSADYLVRGEGEITIPMFLEDLTNGSTGGEYWSEEHADMTLAVVPRFDLIQFRDYIQVGIQYSRGCPFDCEFCDIIQLYGRKSRTKTPEQVIRELQVLYDLGHRGHIDFVDDNFIGNKKNVRTVLPIIRDWSSAHKYPFYFSTESSINLAEDEGLMQMMQDVDFRFVFVGIETPEEEILRQTKKTANLNKSVSDAVEKISSYGMIVNGGFIVGFDNETERSAKNMISCIQDSGICMAMVGKLYALPNTQLTERLKLEGRLFEDGATLKEDDSDLDQLTSGLNFETVRPRVEVLRDYMAIVKHIYAPKFYYERVVRTGLCLKPRYKYFPPASQLFRTLRAFFRVCAKAGLSKSTGWLYWKALLRIVIQNPRALEATVNLSAMFIHFHKQSDHVLAMVHNELRSLDPAIEELVLD
ncbi:B12-binding domain-containing radical SAM protein [bacterium]|nr:B12-binding domain-containing radical SAM protein [bacterium]